MVLALFALLVVPASADSAADKTQFDINTINLWQVAVRCADYDYVMSLESSKRVAAFAADKTLSEERIKHLAILASDYTRSDIAEIGLSQMCKDWADFGTLEYKPK
jgi:hypothetical protein